ncbi:MAG: hypothetical protein E7602_04495 [Ruminococcaceae bacterium]|nr:hypothetical protein [Oscillospiraceae bacterium]
MKSAKRTITQYIKAIYTLTESNGEYTIICIQENKQEGTTAIYKAEGFSSNVSKAIKIFNKIVRGKVLGSTLIDVIYNLID